LDLKESHLEIVLINVEENERKMKEKIETGVSSVFTLEEA
jgi:hypothetical protein